MKSSPRQIKTLIEFHRNFSKGILYEVISGYLESMELGKGDKEEYEVIEIESLADL